MSEHPTPVRCPKCHAEVWLAPGGRIASRGPRGWLSLGVVILVVLGGVGLAYRYRGQLWTVWNLANEATGSPTVSALALAGGTFLALSLVAWMLLPFGIAWAYLDLRRRLRPVCPCPVPAAVPLAGPASVAPSVPPAPAP